MIPISVDNYAKKYVKKNPELKLEDIKFRLRDALKRKNDGACCNQCGNPIWAVGSAIVGHDACFTCITGETDDSSDYEVE
ncbi:MAG: hypothetical protein UMV23_02870 [Halanaerobium sp.]|nr:hypothetical protein [Halanaerobium sp.]